MVNRRKFISKTTLAGTGALACISGLLDNASASQKVAAATQSPGPKRVIFFLQNHCFHPQTCIPEGIKKSGSLDKVKLAKPMAPLQDYTERMHVLHLHGLHTNPNHSAYYGALGGYRGGGRGSVPPGGVTIDYVLSKVLPQTVLPHLCIGMDSLENMMVKPTVGGLSAKGAGQPLFMQSNPNLLYQMLYGGLAKGDMRKTFEANSNLLKHIEKLAANNYTTLPPGTEKRYGQYVQGFKDSNNLRRELGQMSDHLKKFAPVVDDRYSKPEFETDWHDVLLELGISALKSGITNTLTIGSGRGTVDGSWKGLGISKQGHNLGHGNQLGNPNWTKIRQYNSRMLIKIIKELESMPEGNGTMMDNTLIVYTSNNADTQHSNGNSWPFVLLGNFGGRLKTGQITNLKNRPINALYATILQAATGKPVKRFNMSEQMAQKFDSGVGPIKELLV